MTIFILWCLYCNVLVGCMKAFFLSLNVQLEVLKTTNELFIHKSIFIAPLSSLYFVSN